jgi:hypothetical protein
VLYAAGLLQHKRNTPQLQRRHMTAIKPLN